MLGTWFFALFATEETNSHICNLTWARGKNGGDAGTDGAGTSTARGSKAAGEGAT